MAPSKCRLLFCKSSWHFHRVNSRGRRGHSRSTYPPQRLPLPSHRQCRSHRIADTSRTFQCLSNYHLSIYKTLQAQFRAHRKQGTYTASYLSPEFFIFAIKTCKYSSILVHSLISVPGFLTDACLRPSSALPVQSIPWLSSYRSTLCLLAGSPPRLLSSTLLFSLFASHPTGISFTPPYLFLAIFYLHHQSAAVGAVFPPSSKLAPGKMLAFGAGNNIGDNPSPVSNRGYVGCRNRVY